MTRPATTKAGRRQHRGALSETVIHPKRYQLTNAEMPGPVALRWGQPRHEIHVTAEGKVVARLTADDLDIMPAPRRNVDLALLRDGLVIADDAGDPAYQKETRS